MALADLSFKLYTDAGLTSLFGGTLSLLHYTNFSDGSQDTKLYFGSPTVTPSTKLVATSNPLVDNIALTPIDTLPLWSGLTAYTLGTTRQPAVANGYRYVVTTAGTSNSTAPAWNTGIGSTTSDGTIVWTNMGLKHNASEIKIAATSAGLGTALPGAALILGTQVLSGPSNAKEINIRITNNVGNVSDTAGTPDIGISINAVNEVPA